MSIIHNLLQNRRKASVLVVVGAFALAGCGASGSTPAGTDAGNAPSSETTVREVQTAKGTVTLKGVPKRVVVLDIGQLDDSLALGVKPVGMVQIEAGAEPPKYLADKLQGIQDVGTVLQPNLEAIAALNPDVILGSKKRNDKIYDQLTAIAPTILTETIGDDWQGDFKMYADALDKRAEADDLLATYQTSVDALKKKVDAGGAQTVASVVRALPGQVYVYEMGSFCGRILSDAGLVRNPTQSKPDLGEVVTADTLSKAAGDIMFYSVYGKDDSALKQLEALPAWKDIAAVKADKVFKVDDDYWFVGTGYQAALLVVADLEKYLQ